MATVGLTALGTLAYGGHTFTGASKITVSQTPLMDESGYAVECIKYEINVTGYLANDAKTDGDYTGLRKTLNTHGLTLQFKEKGFGNLDINTGAMKDVKGGPHTTVLRWEPIGGAQALEFSWSCIVHLPECFAQSASDVTMARHTGIMSINYDISFSVDENADTTRIISGKIKIAQPRSGAARRKISDSVDRYWSHMTVTAIPGFKRTHNRKISKDKSTLDFTITDTQIPSPNPYPDFVSSISGSHRVSWRRGSSGRNTDGSDGSLTRRNQISMKIMPKAGISSEMGWCIFGEFVSRRMAYARDYSPTQFPMLRSLDVEEDLFGRSASFSASYTFISSMEDIFNFDATGLWKPFNPDNNWVSWKTSVDDTMFIRNGSAGLKHSTENEAIIDLCTPYGFRHVTHAAKLRETTPFPCKLSDTTTPPPPTYSWMSYSMKIGIGRENIVTRQSPLQPGDNHADGAHNFELASTPSQGPGWGAGASGAAPASGKTPGSSSTSQANAAMTASTGSQGALADIIHTGGRGQYTATMWGKAERLYPIPRPTLLSVGDAKATELKSLFIMDSAGKLQGIPVYSGQWAVTYLLDQSPGDNLEPPKRSRTASETPGGTIIA